MSGNSCWRINQPWWPKACRLRHSRLHLRLRGTRRNEHDGEIYRDIGEGRRAPMAFLIFFRNLQKKSKEGECTDKRKFMWKNQKVWSKCSTKPKKKKRKKKEGRKFKSEKIVFCLSKDLLLACTGRTVSSVRFPSLWTEIKNWSLEHPANSA